MKVKKISGFIFLALLGATVNGQVRQPHLLYFMETIPQISQMNPALQPRANGYVMLPNINIDVYSDLAVKNILQKQGNTWFSPIEKKYDYTKLRKAIGKNATMFNSATDVDIFGFGFRTDNGYFSFGLSEHVSGNFTLPSDLFNITDKGFPDDILLDFTPLRTKEVVYMQFRFGYSQKVNDRLSIGVNVKPLIGQVAVVSRIENFKIRTGEQRWDLGAKGNIYSSAPIEVIMNADGKIKEIDDAQIDEMKDDYAAKDWIANYVTDLSNPGIALDFGASYRITERLTVSASLNNLGFISWKKDLNSISFDGHYVFNGVYYDYSKDDDIRDLFTNLGDSILDVMDYSVKNDKFKTALTPVFHAGASYQLTNAVSIGLLSRSVLWKNGVRQSFNTSLCLQPYSFVSMNVGATWQVKGNVYLGGGFMFLLGPLQFYLLVDNVPVYYSSLKVYEDDLHKDLTVDLPYCPERLKSFTTRVGVNLVFGRHGYVNKPMLNKRKSSWD